jgi:hypothetical protein
MIKNIEEEELLNQLCDLYGSDKGFLLDSANPRPYSHQPHTYTRVYADLFSSIKEEELVIFECGIGTNNPRFASSMGINGKPGASLRVWRDYFPKSTIYGADIDKNILFLEDRIFTGYIDQTNPESIKSFWEEYDVYPNIIIDDGLHKYSAGITLFEASFDRIPSGGVYVIEDVWAHDLVKYIEYFGTTNLDVRYTSLARPNSSIADNNLVVVYKNLDRYLVFAG